MKKILIIIVMIILLTGCNKIKSQSHNYFYMDTVINVKIYDKVNDKIFDEIENIYKEYHELTDRYNSYDNLINVYYINNNDSSKETLILDQKLCNIIELGLEYGKKTNNKFNINMSRILDVWKSYRENEIGIPSLNELNKVKESINPIVFVNKCELLNNNPSIDLGAIAKGYATEEVGKYLKSKNINEFIINAGGNVLAGNHYNSDKYKIGLETPSSTKEIYKVLKVTNKSVVTSGGYERFYTFEGKKYHHIIDFNTLYPSEYFKSVTIITDNSAIADILSTSLFLMSIDDGKELIKNLNVEVIWYTLDDQIITTEGINEYE